MMLLHGDCLELMKDIPDGSVDSIVTDPPYGLSFMGKKWDHDVPSVGIWQECLRVLKPGGHLLAFAGTRTQHRMAVNIEDAGFEIRDMIAWVYGSGFPKSHNLKDEWQGWGTALKPALEPITVARKPFKGTVAQNVLAWGTGGLNIDGCRVGDTRPPSTGDADKFKRWKETDGCERAPSNNPNTRTDMGRWPANLIHDGSEEVTELFPQSSTTGKRSEESKSRFDAASPLPNSGKSNRKDTEYTDFGSAARFFYCAKASKRDRDDGLDGFVERESIKMDGGTFHSASTEATDRTAKNYHPTVKPTELMRYLCRLVTPQGGTVLDPFMGSGSTGKAAMIEGFKFIGIEKDNKYFEIAQTRIKRATNIFTEVN